MSLSGRFKSLNVLTATRIARVESRPPDKPNTIFLIFAWLMRLARPMVCIENISSARLSFSEGFDGTNGEGSI